MTSKSLILASTSASRQKMLKNAGVLFQAIPPAIQEKELQKDCQDQGIKPREIACFLAREKSLSIAKSGKKESLIIGADQVLICDDVLLTKSHSSDDAKDKLKFLRGKTHSLISAVCVSCGGEVLWEYVDEAELTMKKISDDDLDHYCALAGPALLRSVGCYELESHGSWLFESVKGDFFTVLGLPLLPLLAYLEAQGVKPA